MADMLDSWRGICKIKIPIVAAVHGFALGGGCELALSCDVIYAAPGTKFGQPEITVGTIPGCGGTQRLIREVGKSRAMEMCLTGEPMLAEEALTRGMISKIFPVEELLEKAVECATKMSNLSKTLSSMVKDSVNKAYELGLNNGLDYEKRLFWGTFGTEDQKEGMGAFCKKIKPDWNQFHK